MARSDSNHSRRPAPAVVEEIGTEPMSGQQREQAVTAFAALIDAWPHGHDLRPQEPGEDRVLALPLPGAASDTDHAA